jgi:quercetin dioxygenase-like cupin family protein
MSINKQPLVTPAASIPENVVKGGTKTSMQVLINSDTAPNFAMRCFKMAPGGGMPKHTNEVEHEQYVLNGKAKIGIGDDVYEVKQGDVVFIPAGIPHWYETLGEEEFQFLCLVPNQQDNIVILKD